MKIHFNHCLAIVFMSFLFFSCKYDVHLSNADREEFMESLNNVQEITVMDLNEEDKKHILSPEETAELVSFLQEPSNYISPDEPVSSLISGNRFLIKIRSAEEDYRLTIHNSEATEEIPIMIIDLNDDDSLMNFFLLTPEVLELMEKFQL